MKVVFYPDITESEVVEVDSKLSKKELDALALDWLESNVSACYEIVEEE